MRELYLDVLDEQTINVQTPVIGIALRVSEQLQEEFGGLLGPTSLCGAELFRLCTTTNAAVEAPKWNALFHANDVL